MDAIQQMQQQMRQMQHQEQQAHQAQTQQGATPSVGNERKSQQLILKGFDDNETFSGCEEQWQNLSWKVKTAVSGMRGELVELLITAEANGVESTEEVLKRKQVCGNKPRNVDEGQQGDVQRACKVHKFRGLDDREERDGVGRSESMGEATCKLQPKNVGTNVQNGT